MDIIVVIVIFTLLLIMLKSKSSKSKKMLIRKCEVKLKKLEKRHKMEALEISKMKVIVEEKNMALEKKMDDFYELRSKELALFSKKDEDIVIERENLMLAKERLFEQKANELKNLELLEKEIKEKRRKVLLNISNYSLEEAKKQLFSELEEELSEKVEKELKAHKEELLLNKKEITRQILIQSMEVVAVDLTNEFSVKAISIPNDDIKGKLIGREGRNIKALENGLGVNLIIDDTPGQIQISSFNSQRRVVAMLCLKELVRTARINQTLIEQEILKAQADVEELIIQKGKDAVFSFGIHDMEYELIVQIGTLHLRSSYGQNVLKHSIEAAQMGVEIAKELGLDPTLMARCLLLHDIGKNDSAEKAISHTQLGYELAKKHNESEIVTNAIRAHHGDVQIESYYAAITIIADTMSAGRQGSRKEQYEDFIKRVTELEAIALEISGVKSAFALQGGRELRVLVIPDIIKDGSLELLSRKIEKEIKERLVFPGKIVVHIIREKRYTKNIKMESKIKEQDG